MRKALFALSNRDHEQAIALHDAVTKVCDLQRDSAEAEERAITAEARADRAEAKVDSQAQDITRLELELTTLKIRLTEMRTTMATCEKNFVSELDRARKDKENIFKQVALFFLFCFLPLLFNILG